MFFAIYNDLKNKVTRYYYLKDKDIYYNEYSCEGCRVYKKNSLYDFYKLFGIPSNLKFLEANNQYKIYLDNNGYKHYVKDGKEDFLQFYLNNGTNCILNFDNSGKKNEKTKKFIFNGALATISVICSIQLFNLLQNNSNYSYENKQSECADEMMNKVSYYNIINMIKELETLPDEHKNDILNSGIIESVLPYYDDFNLSILTQSKLNNLSIEYYDTNDESKSFGHDIGYYDPLVPNVIYIKNGTEDKAFEHEFIHLLQSHIYPLSYLVEPTAELMKQDFFGNETNSYVDEVNNLKLLICTIGPDPILQCSFGGDPSKLLEILENNLEVSDYEKMVSCLSKNESTSKVDQNQEIQRLIEKLYKNIYGTEMKDTLPGYYLIANQNNCSNVVDNRSYLNINKIGLEGLVSFDVNSESYELIANDIDLISIKDVNYYKKEITEEEYILYESNIIKEYEIRMELIDQIQNMYNENGTMWVDILKDGCLYRISREQAVEEGYIKYFIINSEDKINLTEEEWIFDHQDKRITTTLPPITSTFSSSLNEYSEESFNMQVDKMITGMVDGDLDINGIFISNPNNFENNNKYSK